MVFFNELKYHFQEIPLKKDLLSLFQRLLSVATFK